MALIRRLGFIMSFLVLIGCGGGDGGLASTAEPIPDTTPTPDPIVISLSISNELVTEQTPATIMATVMQGTTAITSQVVTFETTLGGFNPESGTALTDSSGVASIVLNSGDVAGAGSVKASIASGEEATIGFTTQGSTETIVRLGSGDPFIEGEIDLSLAQISAGGTTVISVFLIDENGALFNQSVDVNFSSVCAEEAIPSADIDTIITTSSGQASATYLAKGCVGDDPITVNAIVNGQNLSATGSVNVLPADVGSIEFVSASPETIGIIGTGAVGGSESSILVFKVLDTNGNPVNNQEVDFSLSTETGGINLIPKSATTNNEGFAQTVVNSGTVATSVRVTASIVNSEPLISSQSSVLVISTGIPDQDSISISFSDLNPDSWDTDDVEVTVVALLADAFNNPVPDGTAVSFTTEGGAIEPSCTTIKGRCEVKWRSQMPRPEGETLYQNAVPPRVTNIDAFGFPNFMGQKYGGRVSISVSAIGEESFPDLNGNGRFDVCEVPAFKGGVGKPCNQDGTFDESGNDITYSGNDVSGAPYDRSEVFADYNEDGFFNPAEENILEQAGGELEEYIDFNNDGAFNVADGLYNGVLCAQPAHAGCSSTQQSINVSSQGVIVMSSRDPYWCLTSAFDGKNNLYTSKISSNPLRFCEIRANDYNNDGLADEQDRDYDDILVLGPKSSASFSIVLADLHNQLMPTGSTISFVSSIGAITSGESDSLANARNGGQAFGGTFKAGEEIESGTIDLVIEYKSGSTFRQTILSVIVE